MQITQTFRKFALAGLLVATAAIAQTPYDEGQQALREQRWMDAANQFQLAIDAENDQADAALYWRAYAYYKAGRKNEAERELRKLERGYPDSRWIREAGALRVEYQDSASSIESVAIEEAMADEELRLFALSRLMERDPERAVPLVVDLMNNASSQQVRNDALFVLGMSEQPAARKMLSEAAGNSDDPELQMNAIHMLGSMEASTELQSLYPMLESSEVKVAVIEALSIAGDSEALIQYLETEKDPVVRKAAIHGIAINGDDDSMEFVESMYASATSKEEKAAILESLMMMDDAQELALKILRTETDPELQRQAIHVLGIMDATGELAELYTNVDRYETRADVIEALIIADDSEGIANILRLEQDPRLRAQAIRGLAINDSEGASEYLIELYPGSTREEKAAIVESMMISENSQALLELMEKESDPELKREMLQALMMIDSEESDEYLFEILESKN